jgi:hypothetical protein
MLLIQGSKAYIRDRVKDPEINPYLFENTRRLLHDKGILSIEVLDYDTSTVYQHNVHGTKLLQI